MKYTKSGIAALLLTASMLFACSSGSSSKDKQTDNQSEKNTSSVETEDTVQAPDVNYEGYAFRFLTTQEGWGYYQMNAEATGDVLDDATWKRNRTMEEKIGIKIEETAEHYSTVGDTFTKTVMAGEDAYDAATLFLSNIVTYAQNNQLYPLDDLTGLHTENPWWNRAAMGDISISRDQYALIGDINLMFYESHYCMMFNQEMIARYDLENPYDLVKNGTWTFDRMLEMASAATNDVNGNGTVDAGEDDCGICLHSNASIPIITAMGASLFTKNADGIPEFTGINDRFVNAYQKDCALYANTRLAQTQNTAKEVENGYKGVFASGHSLFLIEVIGQIASMRGMTNEFGIVVLPKYDEASDYISPVYHNAIGLCVPSTNSDAERTGTILEYMAALSYDTIRPVYYDIMLGSKLVRDEMSTESLDLILENGRFETAYVYGWGDLTGLIHTNVNTNKTDIASLVEKKVKLIQKDMEKSLEN